MTFSMIAQLWNTNTPAIFSCDTDLTENYIYISMKFRTGVHVFSGKLVYLIVRASNKLAVSVVSDSHTSLVVTSYFLSCRRWHTCICLSNTLVSTTVYKTYQVKILEIWVKHSISKTSQNISYFKECAKSLEFSSIKCTWLIIRMVSSFPQV